MRPDVHLAPECPWYELSELRIPNVDWCELQQCSWIVEPANTWSNLAFVGVAIAIAILGRGLASSQMRFFAPAALLVGVASFVYHASYTFVLQIFDFLGMYVFCYLLLVLNLRRLGRIEGRRWQLRFWQLVAATTLLTVAVDFLGIAIQGLVFVLVLVIVGTEVYLASRGRGVTLGFFAVSAGLLTAAAVFSLLDLTRTWCDPTHPVLQGHAIWHCLSALALFAAFLHYRQFDDALARDEA